MADETKSSPKSHILMFPWLAMGHITAFLHLANKLAERGYNISFLLPNKAKLIVQPLNLHPNLITFHVISIPHVDGLPHNTQTTADVTLDSLKPLLATAMDLTRPQVEQMMLDLNPDFAFYDSAHWVAEIASKNGIKSVSYQIVSAAAVVTVEQLALPGGATTVALRKHEADQIRGMMSMEFGNNGITFFGRMNLSAKLADVIAVRTCREMEGRFCDFLSTHFGKPVLLTGPVLPDSRTTTTDSALDERWANWLGAQEPGSVVYCAFGSEVVLGKEQFQEILLGLELSGYPFFVALKAPRGCASVEEAIPEGFEERVRGRGVVYGGWVQQPLILKHTSVGCFVTHSGLGSLFECLLSSPQIVLVPQFADQTSNARMVGELKVAVEVDKDERDWVSRESLSKAVKQTLDKESEVGCIIRENHAKLREALGSHGAYIDSFDQKLSGMINH